MSDETSPIVVTLKAGTGYDAPWLVIRGDNPDLVTNMLRNLGELPTATVEAANLFRSTHNVGPLLPNAPQEQAPVQQAPPQQPAWGTIPAQGGLQQTNPGQQWGQPAPQQQAPQQQGAQPHPEGLTCPMDGQVLQYKVVTRRSDQKQFKFWACPNQKNKDDGHRSEFAN